MRSFEIDELARDATKETSPVQSARIDVLRIRHGGCLTLLFGSGGPPFSPPGPARGKRGARRASPRAPRSPSSPSPSPPFPPPCPCAPLGARPSPFPPRW